MSALMHDGDDDNEVNSDNHSEMNVEDRTIRYYHRCGRMLCTNSVTSLIDLQELCHTICNNIIQNPKEVKYQHLKLSNKLLQTRLIPRKGGLEFLLALNFEYQTHDFQKFLVLRGNETEDIDNIKSGLKWLDETTSTCIEMSKSHINQSDQNRPCAQCIIQIRISKGLTITGGFSTEDKLESVLEFVRCYYMSDKIDAISLSLPHATKSFDIENMEKTLKDLDLSPRSILIASTLSDVQRVEQMQEVKQKTNNEIKKNVVNADVLKREKMKKVEQDKEQKKHIIASFTEDRKDIKDRTRP